MIVIDTNVISEYLKPNANPDIVRWLGDHAGQTAVTSITIAESYYGAFRLPEGTRRRALLEFLDATYVDISSAGRVYSFDHDAAIELARYRADREREGRTRPQQDLMIAAICKVRKVPLATRNVRDFEGLGIDVIDPLEGIVPVS